MRAVNPFLDRLDNNQQRSEFMQDIIGTIIEMGLTKQSLHDPEDLCFVASYKLIIAYGKK